MIKLTRLQGEAIYINEDNIQWIECIPDTTITFMNGNRFIVTEKIEEVLNLIEKSAREIQLGSEEFTALPPKSNEHFVSKEY